MGYRSEGKLLIKTSVLNQHKVLGTLPGFIGGLDREDFEDGVTCLTFQERKMYDRYPDVAEFYCFLDDLDGVDDVPYQYIEVGEDGDIQERGNFEFGMYTSVNIHSDYDY